MAKRKKTGVAPYTKYGKAPFKYSEIYYRWKAAILAGHKNDADQLSVQHQRYVERLTP